jgi:AcrR family transcriptional regulator
MSEYLVSKNNGRERLMDAALNLFSEKGYHATSVREISDLAKINVSQISFYFGGKQGLLNAIFEDLVKANLNNLGENLKDISTLESFKEGLTVFLNQFVDTYIKNDKLFRLFWDELERGHEEAQKIFPETFGKVHQILENHLESAKKVGFICEQVDIKLLALQVLSPFLSLMTFEKTARFHNSLVSLQNNETKEKLIRQTVEGIILH